MGEINPTGAGADQQGLLPGPGGGLIRAALIMVGCLAACSGSTPGKTTTPATTGKLEAQLHENGCNDQEIKLDCSYLCFN